MIVALADKKEGSQNVVIVGLSKENVNRLIGGKPIYVDNQKTSAMPMNVALCIIYGETEQSLYEMLKKQGLFTSDTVVIDKTSKENPDPHRN